MINVDDAQDDLACRLCRVRSRYATVIGLPSPTMRCRRCFPLSSLHVTPVTQDPTATPFLSLLSPGQSVRRRRSEKFLLCDPTCPRCRTQLTFTNLDTLHSHRLDNRGEGAVNAFQVKSIQTCSVQQAVVPGREINIRGGKDVGALTQASSTTWMCLPSVTSLSLLWRISLAEEHPRLNPFSSALQFCSRPILSEVTL
nr:hypothetical protein CFP56_13276 [Quercus suber]